MKIVRDTGIFLLLASVIYTLGIDSYTLMGPIFFVFGLSYLAIGLLLRKVRLSLWWQLAIVITPFAIFVAILGENAYYQRTFKQTVLLPEGYLGRFMIIYDVAEGQPKRWENGRRLIVVKKDGVALTQFGEPRAGVFTSDTNYYYLTEQGERKRIYEETQAYNAERGVDREYTTMLIDSLVVSSMSSSIGDVYCIEQRDSIEGKIKQYKKDERPIYPYNWEQRKIDSLRKFNRYKKLSY